MAVFYLILIVSSACLVNHGLTLGLESNTRLGDIFAMANMLLGSFCFIYGIVLLAKTIF